MDRNLIAVLVVALVAVGVVLLRRRRPPAVPRRVHPADLGLAGSGVGVVGFSSPYCIPCRAWEAALRESGIAWSKVEISERPDLARKYGVKATPLVLAVRLPGGEVVEAFGEEPSRGAVERLKRHAARSLGGRGGPRQGTSRASITLEKWNPG